MSQQTFTPGATQVAEPPAPLLPSGEAGDGGDDNRRKLMIVGAAVGVVVLAIVAFFLLKGGGSSPSNDGAFVAPHHRHAVPAAAAQAPVVKLPKHVAAPVGRDPFKALYVAPGAGAPAQTSGTTSAPSTAGTTTTTSGGTTTSTSGGTTTTSTASTPTYHPVWVKLRAITSSTATFDVGYSNNKSLKVVRYSSVVPLHSFAGTFELLSVRNGVASLRYGDGSPFSLTLAHPTMIVG